jgi:hypothetical protein
MAAGQGNKIEAQDYNNIFNIISPVIGRNFGGTADVGYDNSPVASAVAANAKISAVQWGNLRTDISRCRGHQTGVDLLTNTTTVNGQTPLNIPNPSAQFTATASGTTLAVSAVSLGTIQIGSVLSGAGISGTYTITEQTSGTAGSSGNYTVTPALSIPTSQTVVSTFFRQILENDRALYATMAQAAFDNRIITPPASIPAGRRTQANLVSNQSRLPVANGGGWNGIIRQTITITFPEEVSGTTPPAGARTTARAYFNSGSQFLFSAQFTPSNSQSKNLSWETLCSNMGTIRFGINSISDSGNTSSSTATIQSFGFSNLPATGSGPSSTQLLYTRTITFSASAGNIGNYNPNRIRLYGKKVTAGNIDTFTFVFEFDDAAVADTPPAATPPFDTPIDELVNGTLTTTIQAEYANSVSYISVIPPTAATTGIV